MEIYLIQVKDQGITEPPKAFIVQREAQEFYDNLVAKLGWMWDQARDELVWREDPDGLYGWGEPVEFVDLRVDFWVVESA